MAINAFRLFLKHLGLAPDLPPQNCMYRFQITAATKPGETIVLVGSCPELGSWDIANGVPLRTGGDRYPLWWVDVAFNGDVYNSDVYNGERTEPQRIEYKYVRLGQDGQAAWEGWGHNRWIPLEPELPAGCVIVEDGLFGNIHPHPYGYFADPIPQALSPKGAEGLKVVVIGSSVALGCSAWLLRGWSWRLSQALRDRYGHQLVNRSEIGANVSGTIARFSQVVTPEQPDIVIIALSLGNEGFASSSSQQRRAIQRHFENGLQQLIKMTRELGARPILGGLYPNGGYTAEHCDWLRETHDRMATWGVPLLDWWAVLADGSGRWQPGLAFDPAHPNTRGHQLMYEAIDLNLFQPIPKDLNPPQTLDVAGRVTLFQDPDGFEIGACKAENSFRILNTSPHTYQITPNWLTLQAALQTAAFPAGVYMAEAEATGQLFSLFIQDEGQIATTLSLPPATDLTFYPAFHFFASQRFQVLFFDGPLKILRRGDRRLYLINKSDHEYNLHPMWSALRAAFKAMPTGLYEDPHHPEIPFRSLMVGREGLESRVKVPAQSAIALEYRCPLSEVNRVAILPLGDRCAVRMLLYKLEYDGPAFPFDLTRTTNLADVADLIQNDFRDMWNPAFLSYNAEEKRIYHTQWTGLSFAHEVEDYEDPVQDMSPIHERMQVRYSARAKRFSYTLEHCDKVLFVRTGGCDRATVIDLVEKLKSKCQDKPFRLLLISPQNSDEFAGLPNVLHQNLAFNPDRMYEDLGYWQHCTERMGEILKNLGISSKNLFWCPPNP